MGKKNRSSQSSTTPKSMEIKGFSLINDDLLQNILSRLPAPPSLTPLPSLRPGTLLAVASSLARSSPTLSPSTLRLFLPYKRFLTRLCQSQFVPILLLPVSVLDLNYKMFSNSW